MTGYPHSRTGTPKSFCHKLRQRPGAVYTDRQSPPTARPDTLPHHTRGHQSVKQFVEPGLVIESVHGGQAVQII